MLTRVLDGPTETTIWSTCYKVTAEWVKEQLDQGRSTVVVPIGSAISETNLYIVSEDEPYRELGEFMEGELWIGGIGVAAGYLHAPELTVQRFLPNPFGAGRVYRTGDVVRRLNDGLGSIVFVRRMDDQVKIGGFRIELQEIESVYMRHPSVEQAVAVVRNGALVVYLKLVLSEASNVRQRSHVLREIRETASRSLTYYMMPKSTVVVESFPQTANGKLDRKALPDPPDEFRIEPEAEADIEQSSPNKEVTKQTEMIILTEKKESSPHTQPVDRDQLLLAHRICDVVAMTRGRRPGIHSSFAAIGVDSLAAVVFVAQLHENLPGCKVSPATVFGPGMTALELARVLLPQVREHSPQVLDELRMSDGTIDVEVGKVNGIEESTINMESEDDISTFDKLFDATIANARSFLEGMRGLFAFMVLWDHYSPLRNSPAWGADTAMFVMISGFTTSLQLRLPPVIRKTSSGQIILPPEPFDWKSFVLSRAVGIFPILWLGLLLSIPYWEELSGPYKGPCAPLYVIGMQSWWLPACSVDGPNQVRYASIIWNIFLIYGLLRWIFYKGQTWFCEFFSNAAAKLKQIATNRPEGRLAYYVIGFQLVGMIGLLLIGRYFFLAKV